MTAWQIKLNGKSYSIHYSNLRSIKHAAKIAEEWKTQHVSVGYKLPEGEVSANLYNDFGLDKFGN